MPETQFASSKVERLHGLCFATCRHAKDKVSVRRPANALLIALALVRDLAPPRPSKKGPTGLLRLTFLFRPAARRSFVVLAKFEFRMLLAICVVEAPTRSKTNNFGRVLTHARAREAIESNGA
jgi:hypothetical protein